MTISWKPSSPINSEVSIQFKTLNILDIPAAVDIVNTFSSPNIFFTYILRPPRLLEFLAVQGIFILHCICWFFFSPRISSSTSHIYQCGFVPENSPMFSFLVTLTFLISYSPMILNMTYMLMTPLRGSSLKLFPELI